jgi:hypothetical protein
MALKEQYQSIDRARQQEAQDRKRPRQPTTEDAATQAAALTQPVREAVSMVEYVDAELGFGRASEECIGTVIGLNAQTSGVPMRQMKPGMRLHAAITRFNHAVSVKPA